MQDQKSAIFEDYLLKLENLNLDNISSLLDLLSEDIEFVDPFNKSKGRDAYRRIFEKAFKDTLSMDFKINKKAYTENTCLCTWNLNFMSSSNYINKKNISLHGSSEIIINENYKISHHTDFWDSSVLFSEIKILGKFIKFLVRRAGPSD